MTSKIMYMPSQTEQRASQMWQFLQEINQKHGQKLATQKDLHEWSVKHPEAFWTALWHKANIIGHLDPNSVLTQKEDIQKAVFFEKSTLNFAENLLRNRTNAEALVFWGEDQVKRRMTFKELYDHVSVLRQYLKEKGLKKGDRVGGLTPNTPEALIAMLACTSLGAIWASCSPDFGTQGMLDRFEQIEPKFLFATDYYLYKGKKHFINDKLKSVQEALPSLTDTILFSYDGTAPDPLPCTTSWHTIRATYSPQDIQFESFPFNTPLYIMFSSGTTGAPKCIVHGAGGTLLQHVKEHQLHSDVKEGDRVFYFTTCGWMMWHWQMSALASGATLLLYDGSPFYPDGHILFQYAEEENMTLFGTAAKYISALENEGLSPRKKWDLSALKVMTSTGSPLAPESFDYAYAHIKNDMRLVSLSGGTDIISCFVLGSPLKPVIRGEIQCAGLGMDVQVFNDSQYAIIGEKGELVCRNPFPSRPLGFWGDDQGEKYHHAYFSKFPNVWCHGDFSEQTSGGGFIILGRSDAVLNRGGVRIGTAEIYRQVEKIKEVQESIAVGQPYQGDIRVILFVKMNTPHQLNDDLRKKIAVQIRKETTPRHVPDLILEVPDIPRTKNGKIVELAVNAVIQGLPIKNKEALQNPEILDFFKNLDALK